MTELELLAEISKSLNHIELGVGIFIGTAIGLLAWLFIHKW